MKAHLTHWERDFGADQPSPWNVRELSQDLDLNMLLHAMAREDEFLLEVSRSALAGGLNADIATILYRQEVLKDCLENPSIIREIYGIVVNAIEATKRQTWGIVSHYPSSMLYGATDLLEILVGTLIKLRDFSAAHADRFTSEAFTTLFAMLARELNEEYLNTVQGHLAMSRFKKGLLASARLGDYNESTKFVLCKPADKKGNWFVRLVRKGPPGYTFHLQERDEAGARIISDMRHRAISRVAVALAESADHVLSFFKMLRRELAFYVACTNLHETLTSYGDSICFPRPLEVASRELRFQGLYDVSLSLRTKRKIVANTTDASCKNLIVITGANQGGKSSFLRSIGLAQLMMQCGMFVGADDFEGEVCPALLTHYKREEDVTMQSGKFDEELSRMNEIVEHIQPNATILFNESFAATNEREGSEIARQIVSALLERHIRIFYVTHLYEFARGFFDSGRQDVLFLRAEREVDGSRSFRLREAEPLDTSYGEDLYRKIFEPSDEAALSISDRSSPTNAG